MKNMSNLLQITLYHIRQSSFKITSSAVLTTFKRLSVHKIPGSLSRHTSFPFKRYNKGNFFCTRAYDINTNVTKDVILFKYDNPRFYKMLNIFALSQFLFWSYLSHFAFTSLRDAPVVQEPGKELRWYEKINLGENKYRNVITLTSFLIGYGVLFVAWTFTLRSVRYLILRKGGKDVSIVTYTPFGQNRIITVPLKHIAAQQSRETSSAHLPLKIRNKMLFYVLDMKGEFKNTQLYDYTVGLKRHF